MAKPNILFICMDSLRYDNYVKARTPNFDSIGTPQRLHSQSCWTTPSIIGYLLSHPPIGVNHTLFPPYDEKNLRFIPEYYKGHGYVNAFLSSNAYFYKYDLWMNKSISRWFDHWLILKYLADKHDATEPIVQDAVKIVAESDAPLFMFLLLMDTHNPYYDGENTHHRAVSTPRLNMDAQVRATEYIDTQIKPLLDAFREKGNTIVYITSDHGEHAQYGHDPSRKLEYTDKLFEIPFIRGEL